MQQNYQTERLVLKELSLKDAAFVKELVNTPDWIKFIGNRNINSKEDTIAYIQKLMDNPQINYWVVRLQDKDIPIGVITFIKKDYLEHYDIGFAFLSKYTKKGYAYEASKVVLNDIRNDTSHKHILATTVRGNTNSIKLLEKLEFYFDDEIKHENDLLLVYML